jgi:hypothetical protein
MMESEHAEATAALDAARARRDKTRREAVRLSAVVATLRRNRAGACEIEAAREAVRTAEARLRVAVVVECRSVGLVLAAKPLAPFVNNNLARVRFRQKGFLFVNPFSFFPPTWSPYFLRWNYHAVSPIATRALSGRVDFRTAIDTENRAGGTRQKTENHHHGYYAGGHE